MAEEYVPYTGPVVTRTEALALGLPRYFTGKPCSRGHLSQRRTVNWDCTACDWKNRCRDRRNATERAARLRNPEGTKARTNRYTTSPKGQETRHAYYVRNIDTIRATAKAHREADPDKTRAQKRAYYEANKPRVIQKVNEWNAANPGGQAARGRNYRARVNGAEGSHTLQEIEALYDKQGGRCVYCGGSLKKGFHADHIKPLSKGGSNWISNIQLLCGPCNNHKRATDPIEFARRNGRLL